MHGSANRKCLTQKHTSVDLHYGRVQAHHCEEHRNKEAGMHGSACRKFLVQGHTLVDLHHSGVHVASIYQKHHKAHNSAKASTGTSPKGLHGLVHVCCHMQSKCWFGTGMMCLNMGGAERGRRRHLNLPRLVSKQAWGEKAPALHHSTCSAPKHLKQQGQALRSCAGQPADAAQPVLEHTQLQPDEARPLDTGTGCCGEEGVEAEEAVRG